MFEDVDVVLLALIVSVVVVDAPSDDAEDVYDVEVAVDEVVCESVELDE